MKQLIALFISTFLVGQVLADQANLTIKFNGPIKGTDYLCLNNVGCVNIKAGVGGFKFPLIHGELNRIAIVDQNLRVYPQTLPKSCDIQVGEHENITVTGKLVRSANQITMQNLKCQVVKS